MRTDAQSNSHTPLHVLQKKKKTVQQVRTHSSSSGKSRTFQELATVHLVYRLVTRESRSLQRSVSTLKLVVYKYEIRGSVVSLTPLQLETRFWGQNYFNLA